MDTYNLTSFQRRLLVIIQHRADMPIQELAYLLKEKSRTIIYNLERLIEQKVIIDKNVFIDAYSLGYTDYQLFFSISSASEVDRNKIITKIKEMRGVSWFARVGGEFEFAISVLAQHVSELKKILFKISDNNSGLIQSKSVLIRTGFYSYPRKYLDTELDNIKVLSFGTRDTAYHADKLDLEILKHAATGNFISIRKIAKDINENHATVQRRWNGMVEAKVIKGIFYRLNSSMFNAVSYRLLVESSRSTPEFQNKLRNFAKVNPYILRVMENIGAYDNELDVEVPNSALLLQVLADLRQNLGESISKILPLQVFHHIKYSAFPFK